MLKYGNRDFRSLQEQVYANMKNIQDIIDGSNIIADFKTVNIVGQVEKATDLPDPETYAGNYGDAILVGEGDKPADLYVFTKAYENENAPQWFNVGEFPLAGPQGPQGETGETGPQGHQGEKGDQGESVQGAAIRNGHLILTLTNGHELDTGNLGAVSGFSINDSQHLIVTYQNGTTQDLGAIFTGDVTLAGNLTAAAVKTDSLTSDESEIVAQKPVVEVMNGYSITPTAENINLLYAGAAKNGNKLSFAFFGTYTYKSGDVIIPFANIGIPAALGDKIVPYELSGENRMVYSGVASLFSSRTTYKNCIMEMQKLTNSQLRIIFVGLDSSDLADGTTYYFRFEITFLLSDNLAARE